MGWFGRMIRRLMRLRPWAARTAARVARSPLDHVVILDGTMSSLKEGFETNAGRTYKLLREAARGGGNGRGREAGHGNGATSGAGARLSLYYEAGVQWQGLPGLGHVITGQGLNAKIRRAYGMIASRYRPGDRIFLFGYSRGAYAVRSLAGLIDRIGLLRAEAATERNIRQIWRHYRTDPHGPAARAFAAAHCHAAAGIEMIGVWDTVKSLGLRLPVLWRLTEERHAFHSHHLGHGVRHGYHALAMDETREAFAPVLWECPEGWQGRVEQMWFRGCHGDVGGQLDGFEAARPLANIPLVWMLERAEGCGLALPEGWRARFPCDASAPMVGSLRGLGKFFLLRRRRVIGRDPSEAVHPTALEHLCRHRPARVLDPALLLSEAGRAGEGGAGEGEGEGEGAQAQERQAPGAPEGRGQERRRRLAMPGGG